MSDVLFGNNNKAVIKKVANRSFHSNKKRNILAVIAIALTTFLLTAVLTIGFGAENTMQYSEARLLGTQAHALVQGMTKKQAEQLRENGMFEKVGTQIALAFLENTKQLNVEMDYVDETLIEVRFMTPNIGTIPKAENEVLVSSNVLEDLGIPKKAGETLPVDLKVDGKIEHFDMKVSGIYEPVKDDVGFVMVSKAFMEAQEDMVAVLRKDRENGNYYNADVILKDPAMAEERIGELVCSIGGNPDDREAENYVRIAPTPVAAQSDGNLAVWMAAGVFGILFMFCGYLLIYNVFDMGVTNDVRQYGLLRTIGMTPKQVKGLVRKQAMYLFLIGTPIGVVLGILLGKGMLPSALQVFVAELGEKNVVVGSLPYLPIIIGSVLFSALTVWISTRKSAKKASRVSPIEAVRYQEFFQDHQTYQNLLGQLKEMGYSLSEAEQTDAYFFEKEERLRIERKKILKEKRIAERLHEKAEEKEKLEAQQKEKNREPSARGRGKGGQMTVEGQRYLEECRKVLKEEQMDAVSMGLDFGLPVSDIQKVVKSNQEAPVMKAIIIGLMEGIGEIDFLCEGNYNQFQVREIVEGLKNGLDLEEVKTYAGNELPASRMRTMRIQLEESKAKKEVPKDEEMRSYMKNLMGIMEQSIQQFRESNDRFTALSSLVKEHVVEEKNQEIKDLYENLQYKDKNIQELKEKLARKEQEIQDLKKEAEKYREKTEAASRETKVVLEEKSIQTAEGQQKSKHRLLGIAMLGKKVPKSVVEKILEYNLSAEQLEEIRQCVESGLADAEILQVMENSPSPERMKKMREIILLMRKRKAGV